MAASVEMPRVGHRVFWLVALLLAEVAAVIFVLQVLTDFECRATEAESACRAVRSVGLRGLCVMAAIGLFLWIRRDLGARLIAAARAPAPTLLWLGVHGAGLAVMLGPWLLASDTLEARAPLYLASLGLGATFAALGGLFWAVPPRIWGAFLREGGWLLAFAAAVAVTIPDLADAIGIAWTVDVVLSFTFWGIVLFLKVFGPEIWMAFDPPRLGVDGFIVEIADSCSGVEGLALITGFLLIYSVVMRGTVRQNRLWLVVWPLALLASWTLNVVRIGILMLIGAHVSPDLAVNGFHSFAGWIFFTLLALAILALVPALSWLDKPSEARGPAAATSAPLPPLTEDWSAARIVPFIVFMLSGMLAPALLLHPELAYPAQMLAIGAALWVFRKGLGPVFTAFDPIAVASGIFIAALWIGLYEPSEAPLPGLATLGPVALALWVAFRVIGTTVIIPIVEEAFFRGYLMTRLTLGGRYGLWVGVIASTAAFAALHGRYLEAGIAGLVFAAVMLRRGRLADAVLSHAVANGLIAAMALALGDWSLI